MSFTVVVMPLAKRQAREIDAWWRENRPEAPLHFVEDVAAIGASLRDFPDRGRKVRARGYHVMYTARTTHAIVYRVRPRARRVEIVSIGNR